MPLKIIAAFAQIDQASSTRVSESIRQYQSRLNAIRELNVEPIQLTIDPLSTGWHSELKENHFRSGCAPIMALERAQQLIQQGHHAVIISGDEPLKSGYQRTERHKLMAVYAEDYSIAQLYNDLADEFIDSHDIDEQQFLELADALFNNHSRSHEMAKQQQRAHFSSPEPKWFNHVTKLFRGVDCANPLLDFSGHLLLCSEQLAQQLELDIDSVVDVTGIGLGLLDIDEVQQLPLIAQYDHLSQAYRQACQQSNLDFNSLVVENKALMEVYTCYPVVPLAFLISSGLVKCLSEIPQFLKQYLVTITGGMNLARAPWNNPALNGLIEMYQQLTTTDHKYGLVHGNGGIGYRQGVAILQSS